MSFRFSVNADKVVEGRDGMLERSITEIALYEVGPVVWPAYEQTSVSVRSQEAVDALQDPEVRSEIARILAFGTDLPIRSLASDSDPQPVVHSEPETISTPQPEVLHVETPVRTKSQREALVALYL